MDGLMERKRLVFKIVLGFLALLLLELGSALVLWARDGAWPSPSRRAKVREQAKVATAAAVGGRDAERVRQQLERGEEVAEPAAAGDDQTLHPYLGFVQDPAGKVRFWEIRPDGFPKVPDDGPADPSQPIFEVAIFGGSVANGVCFAGRPELLRQLGAAAALAGKHVRVRCFALGGYKQPQQLMALTEALSLGERFDVVLNIDGFNEVALPVAENLKVKTNPFYPRWWPRRVMGVESPVMLRQLGLLELLKEKRLKQTGWCGRPPLSWSPTCHLVWTTADRRAAQRLLALDAEFAAQKPRRRGFLLRGTPFEAPEGEALYAVLAEHWARSSRLMHQLCRAQGIRYFHFLQPNQYLAGSKVMSAEEKRLAWDENHFYKQPAEHGYPALVAAGKQLAAEGVPFTDLTQLFADHPEPLYGDACCHYNRVGNRLFAAAIGATVVAALEERRRP